MKNRRREEERREREEWEMKAVHKREKYEPKPDVKPPLDDTEAEDLEHRPQIDLFKAVFASDDEIDPAEESDHEEEIRLIFCGLFYGKFK